MGDYIMKKIIFIILCTFIGVTGCAKKSEINKNTAKENNTTITTAQVEKEEKLEEEIIKTYENVKPKEWGEELKGVVSHIDNDNKEIALTLDACGGDKGSKYDKELIDFLDKENIIFFIM